MADDTQQPSDKQLIYLARFDARLRAHLKTLITDELIEEHRVKPLGQHSDSLDRVLNYLRRPAKFGLYSADVCREYQVISLPVAPGSTPEPLDGEVYHDKNEAMHAVFLKQIEALQAQ
jgi:branched-chain amino acid transport system permease protein